MTFLMHYFTINNIGVVYLFNRIDFIKKIFAVLDFMGTLYQKLSMEI